MKDMLSSISMKIKYIVILLAALFFAFNIIYLVFIYIDSSIGSDKLFNVLAMTEIALIMFISYSMYNLIKNDSVLRNAIGLMRDEMSDDSTIFNTISDGIIIVDNKGKIRNINHGLCRILGIEESQILNKNLYNLMIEWEDCNENKLLPGIVIESLETQKEYKQQEKVFIRNNEVLYLAVSTYMLRNKSKNLIGVLAVVHDFTQRKKLEQQLMHVEKLATAGQMAAELAHEIKNPICSIKGLIQIMGKKHSLEDSKYYEVITNEIDRISVLLQRFLALTQSKPKLEKTSINALVDEIVPLVESYAESKNINISVDMQREMPNIYADRENIRQVIVNIIQNGIDALHRNGRMNISIWYDQINDLIKMEFKDNGSGIKPEYLDKIFEPFFTTKDNGSGLGLAISHKIIENHCGKLFAFNNLDGGATFVIELPVARTCDMSNMLS
ncbi:MAG TPA: ATP-binding protein [Candidatus Nitrosocosmicus sp.]|nr:ATP-binding protein [Candidatus Nitrosocosmicus sp.]